MQPLLKIGCALFAEPWRGRNRALARINQGMNLTSLLICSSVLLFSQLAEARMTQLVVTSWRNARYLGRLILTPQKSL